MLGAIDGMAAGQGIGGTTDMVVVILGWNGGTNGLDLGQVLMLDSVAQPVYVASFGAWGNKAIPSIQAMGGV